MNTVASFERTGRSAVGEHFDWHPATGAGVEEREGRVFERKLLIADAALPKALVRFEQTTYNSFDEFRTVNSGFETHGVQIDAAPADLVRSPELDRYTLINPIDRPEGAPTLPKVVQELLGWTDAHARTVGAYPYNN